MSGSDKLSSKDLIKAAQCANFMQRFKMAYWKWLDEEVNHTSCDYMQCKFSVEEVVLDKLAMIAWEDLRSSN